MTTTALCEGCTRPNPQDNLNCEACSVAEMKLQDIVAEFTKPLGERQIDEFNMYPNTLTHTAVLFDITNQTPVAMVQNGHLTTAESASEAQEA